MQNGSVVTGFILINFGDKMILCINIGNTHLLGGFYAQDKLQSQFQLFSSALTKEKLIAHLEKSCKEQSISPKEVKNIAICSVVPLLDEVVTQALYEVFAPKPLFLTASHAKRLLNIEYENPQEVGLDRLSTAIAATALYPQKNLIVIDLGTATTFNAITANRAYLGGLIIPGLYIAMQALTLKTASLPAVPIVKPQTVIGKTTVANIQSGLYYSHLGSIREIITEITKTVFIKEPPFIIATGGFASLFQDEGTFDVIIPTLVLDGLYFWSIS